MIQPGIKDRAIISHNYCNCSITEDSRLVLQKLQKSSEEHLARNEQSLCPWREGSVGPILHETCLPSKNSVKHRKGGN